MTAREMRRRVLMVAAMSMSITATSTSAQSAPAPPATAVPAALAYCPLSTRVREVDDTHTRYAVSFRALETGAASGVVALWAGDQRYDVSFHNVVALDSRDRISPETSITVQFPAPTNLSGAVVTAIDEGGRQRACDPWYAPWVSIPPSGYDRSGFDPRTPDERTAEDRFLARARAATAISAPAPVADPLSCSTPYRYGRTVRAVRPDRPLAGTGVAMVMVLLDTSDKIVATRVERSAGNAALDYAALSAARGSDYQGQIFRCRHVMGSYLFSVEFGD